MEVRGLRRYQKRREVDSGNTKSIGVSSLYDTPLQVKRLWAMLTSHFKLEELRAAQHGHANRTESV